MPWDSLSMPMRVLAVTISLIAVTSVGYVFLYGRLFKKR